jgi:3-isopropylmalate dehydrogenase
MVLRHSADLEQDALAVESAVAHVLEQGYRTADLARAGGPGQQVSTQEMGKLVHQALNEIIERRQTLHTV